jgi:hypothetical protein
VASQTEISQAETPSDLLRHAVGSPCPDINERTHICLGPLGYADASSDAIVQTSVFPNPPLLCCSASTLYNSSSSFDQLNNSDLGRSSMSIGTPDSSLDTQSPKSGVLRSRDAGKPLAPKLGSSAYHKQDNSATTAVDISIGQFSYTSSTQIPCVVPHSFRDAPIPISRVTQLLRCNISTCSEAFTRQKDLQ